MHGLLITFLPAICMPVMGSLNFANCTFSDADFSWLGIVLGNIASYPNKIILDRIMDMNELTEKLKEVFGK